MTFDDLPTDAKMMCAYALRIGLFKDEATYLEQYAKGAPSGFRPKSMAERERLEDAWRAVVWRRRWE